MNQIPYRTIRKLGSGGMADVFEVESPDSRRFALKVFRREKESPFLQDRFIAEAKILKTIYHPRIVRVHEYGIDEATGKPWFVMDLVLNPDGTPSTLEAVRRHGGKAATPESDFYALGVAFFRLLTGMWYEPGTNALDILAPFPRFWRKELPRLLGGNEKAARSHVRRRYAILVSAVLCVTFATALFLPKAGFLASVPAERPPTNFPASGSSWTLPGSFAVPRLQSLPLDKDGTTMEFCACPPGEFMMSNVGDDTTCHKVKITRPFWIG